MQPIDVHHGATTDYYDAGNRELIDRWQPIADWLNARLERELDPYSKVSHSRIAPEIDAHDRAGRRFSGINFASQDYLALSSHPSVLKAAAEAAEAYGVHSAGSAALMGLTGLTVELEARVAGFVQCADATVFPTGWAAGFGAIRALVRPHDHIVIDVLAHACLQEAAVVSTKHVYRVRHCSASAVEQRLSRIRAADRDAGILVVTESLFSMDSDVAPLPALQDMCRTYGATLFVDVAHDLGALGDTGRGILEMLDMLGQTDIVMGSFSKTFASNGGFVASDHPALKLALRYGSGPLTFSNSLSPVQAAVVLEAFDLIESPGGALRRLDLIEKAEHLREALSAADFEVLGEPSAIVPVVLGDSAISREMTAHVLRSGALVNLVEYPAVARNGCRWRLQMMCTHTTEQIDRFVEMAVEARSAAHDTLRLETV